MDTQQEIAQIRKAIKAKVPTLSVRNNRGTAWGWVGIHGSGGGGMFTDAERDGLKALGLSPGGNYCNISPDARAYWLKRLTGEGAGKRCSFCSAPASESFGCPCDLVHWTCPGHAHVRDCARVGEVRR